MTNHIDLNDIRLLMQVVASGSFTAASRATSVPKSTISQRITSLERALGTGLLRHTSRSFSLTEAGARLLPYARACDTTSREIEREILKQGSEIVGTLRVSSSNTLGQYVLASLIPRFLAQHSRALICLKTSDRLVDLDAEGFDMALHVYPGPLNDSTLEQRFIARMMWSLVASPAWIETHGMPSTPEELRSDQALCFSWSPDCSGWTLSSGDKHVVLALLPRFVSNDMVTLRLSAIAGGGVVCLPSYILSSALLAGQLEPLLPDWSPSSSIVSIVKPILAQSSQIALAFCDFLAAEIPRLLQG